MIWGGPDWYRFFGAGERMARAAYAFAGAGLLPRLPLMRLALVLISAIYLLRGSVLFLALAVNWGGVTPFTIWSSLIVLVYGVAYAVGTWKAWPMLGRRPV